MRSKAVGTCLTGIAVVFSLLTGSASAQGVLGNSFQNWNFLGSGARARGMGGAFLGISDDANAATWNPAGLIYNEGVSVTMNYSLAHVGLDLDSRSVSKGLSSLSAATFLAPLTLRDHEFLLSAYYNRLQDVYAQSEFNVDNNTLTHVGVPFSAHYLMTGNLAVVGGGFGTVIKGGLSLGGTLNIATGDGVELDKIHLDSNRYSGAISQDVYWNDKSDLDYSGVNVNVGVLYKADRWSAGMIFSPRWTLTQKLHYESYTEKIETQIPVISPTLVPGPHGTDRQIVIPYTVGLGGAYRLTDNVRLAADYQFRAFKREGSYGFQASAISPDTSFETLPTKWYNLHQVRVGAEYMRETRWGTLPFRVGLRNEPMLIGNTTGSTVQFEGRDSKERPVLTKDAQYLFPLTFAGAVGSQVNGWTLAFGSGVYWSQIHLDMALEFTGYSYDEKAGLVRMVRACHDCEPGPKVFTDEWGKRFEEDYGTFSRTYKDNRVRLSLNFTGYF